MRREKAMLSIRTMAMIALGIMIIVLMYMSFESWTSSIVEQFLSNFEFSSP